MMVYDGTYCVSTTKDYTGLKTTDVSESCSYDELHNIAGTLSKNFYEKSGKTDRSLVNSITFYSDGRTISGAESYDVSEKGDNSIIMYVKPISDSSTLLDLTIVANGKIAFPKDSSNLLYFFKINGCSTVSNITSIQLNNSIDTSKVTNMRYMFAQAMEVSMDCHHYTSACNYSVKQLNDLDLSDFDTSNVVDMYGMFMGNQSDNLNVNNFNTENVTNMGGMFRGIKSKMLNLSNFNTSKVTNMTGMFQEIKNIKQLDISSFDVTNVTNSNDMFRESEITTGYARTQTDADKFNASSNKPSTLTFIVK